MKRLFAAGITVLVMNWFQTAWPAGRLQFSGYVKNFTVLYKFPENSPFGNPGSLLASSDSRFRLNVAWKAGSRVSFDAAYDLAPRIRSRDLNFVPGGLLDLGRRTYRFADLDYRLYPAESDPAGTFGLYQNLDRAQVGIRFDFADLYIGRQAVAWGSARVLNPTDVLTPFAYAELDVEDRVGVDAVRLRAPLGPLGEVDVGYVFGRDFEFANSAFFLRGKVYWLATDLALLTVGFQENLLVGFDLSRALLGAGVYLEGGQVLAGALADSGRIHEDDYFRLSVGADYTLRDGTYLFGEYHFNQAGASDPSKYLDNLIQTAYLEGAVYLFGRHYVAGGLTRQFNPLLTAGVQLLVNAGDGSFFLVPNLEYNIRENFYLSVGGYLGAGRRAESDVQLKSEFGSYPGLFFGSFRHYFSR